MSLTLVALAQMMPGVPEQLIEWIAKAGGVAAPIFAFLWWDERSQRMATQSKLEALSERTVSAMVEFKGLLQTVIDIFNGRKS